jgi:hypothetical protein
MASGMFMKKPGGRVFDPSDPLGHPTGGAKQPTGLMGDITSAFKSQFPGVSKKVGELRGAAEDMFEGTDKEAMMMTLMSSQSSPQKDFNPLREVRRGRTNPYSVGKFSVIPPRRKQRGQVPY